MALFSLGRHSEEERERNVEKLAFGTVAVTPCGVAEIRRENRISFSGHDVLAVGLA
jgi:hypothetical protein